MKEDETYLQEELAELKAKYDKLSKDYDKLIKHFVPWVITHPQMLPEGWSIGEKTTS